MLGIILRRLLSAVLVLWGVATVVFLLLRVLPGDPARTILAGSGAPQAAILQLRQQLGLDDPLLLQYVRFLADLARGELGRSLFSHQSVTTIIGQQLPATFELAAGALMVTTLAGLGLGILAALRAGSWVDWLTMGGAVLGTSLPIFWSGLLMIWLFSVNLRWLPASGVGSWQHLVMPSLLLGLVGAGPLARLVRANLLDVLRADYILVARTKGLPSRLVIGRHALNNALLPGITLIGLQAGFLLGGTVVTETVFNRPGLGRVVVEAILAKDLPVVQGVVLLIAACYVAINLVVDLINLAFDPRLRT